MQFICVSRMATLAALLLALLAPTARGEEPACDPETAATPCPAKHNPLARLKKKATAEAVEPTATETPTAETADPATASSTESRKLKMPTLRMPKPERSEPQETSAEATPRATSSSTAPKAKSGLSGLSGLTRKTEKPQTELSPSNSVSTPPKPTANHPTLKMPPRPVATAPKATESEDSFSPLLGGDEPPPSPPTAPATPEPTESPGLLGDLTPPQPTTPKPEAPSEPAAEPGLLGDSAPPPPANASSSAETPSPASQPESASVFSDVGLPPAEPKPPSAEAAAAPAAGSAEPQLKFEANYNQVFVINTQNGDKRRVAMELVAPNRWEADVEFDVEEGGDLGAFMFEATPRGGAIVDLGLLKLPSHDVYYAGIGYRDGQAYERPDMAVGGILFGIPKPGKGKFHLVFDDIKRFYTSTRN